MVSIAVGGVNGWRASDLELRFSEVPSYTTVTLQKFHERGFAPSELFFIIGADAFAEIGTWKDYPKILDRAHFAVISRPGCPVDELPRRLPLLKPRMMRPPLDEIGQIEPVILLIDEPTADVSSTEIRDRRSAGKSIAGLVHPGVQQHIEQHGLYTSPIPGRRAMDQATAPSAGRLHGES
jgi:nicotinate-nucleotide adenylyltransferase